MIDEIYNSRIGAIEDELLPYFRHSLRCGLCGNYVRIPDKKTAAPKEEW
ncbi:MAG: hypothetical protein WBK46_15885 [Ruminococcus flavefaciens]